MEILRKITLILTVCTGIALAVIRYSAAAPQNGITISPAITNINLMQAQTTASFPIEVTNNTRASAHITISAEDFTALNQNGDISYLKEGSKTPHGLASALSSSPTQLVLEPGEQEHLTITIANTDQLAPGGHYGAVVFKLTDAPSISGNVSVNQTVTSLVFLSTYGQGIQKLSVTNPKIAAVWVEIPNTVNLVLANVGNTQTVPRGIVEISDRSGKVIAHGLININSGLILPGSSRLFSTGLTPSGAPLWPGTYRMKVSYRVDGDSAYKQYEQDFFFIDIRVITGTIVLAMVVALLFIKRFARHLSNLRK